MRTKTLSKAKLVIRVQSDPGTKNIETVNVFDNRTNTNWSNSQIEERGITWFIDFDNMKESLNWYLNGDETKFQFKWVNQTEGIAFVFD